MSKKVVSFTRLIKSFGYAIAGIWYVLKNEPNAKIHSMLGLCAIILGFIFKISATEWTAIIIISGCVISAEAMNTGIEALCDLISEEYHEKIKIAKDVAAGGVLILAIVAVIIGCIIFIPKFFNLL